MTGVRPWHEFTADGSRGAKKGVQVDCANAGHSFDQLSVKIEGMAEPPFIVPDGGYPEGMPVEFKDLKVTQYAKRGGGGLALSATASDVKLIATPASSK